MSPFFGTKRKNIELGIMLGTSLLVGLLFSVDYAVLFAFGFVWNWVASHDLAPFFVHRRYRFSTLKTVFNLQALIEKPFLKSPQFLRLIVRSLPAGIFWTSVILFIGSELPWWATFIGSITFELIQLRPKSVSSDSGPLS